MDLAAHTVEYHFAATVFGLTEDEQPTVTDHLATFPLGESLESACAKGGEVEVGGLPGQALLGEESSAGAVCQPVRRGQTAPSADLRCPAPSRWPVDQIPMSAAPCGGDLCAADPDGRHRLRPGRRAPLCWRAPD
ncbi:hypothetical protein GCM10010219_65430 [Streptomyces netropsis]|nr:hypothetical protein GCM10010219_65430 [Streptomyces netropsis]